MAKNVEININVDGSSYEVLYPKASYTNMADTLSISNTTGKLGSDRITDQLIIQSGERKGDNTTPSTLNYTLSWSIPIKAVWFNLKNAGFYIMNGVKPRDTSISLNSFFMPGSSDGISFVFLPIQSSNSNIPFMTQSYATITSAGSNGIVVADGTLTSTSLTLKFSYIGNEPTTKQPWDFYNSKNQTYYWTVLGIRI